MGDFNPAYFRINPNSNYEIKIQYSNFEVLAKH